MDQIKEAFQKVKKDMDSLREDVFALKEQSHSLDDYFLEIKTLLKEIKNQKINEKHQFYDTTQTFPKPTLSTHSSTDKDSFKPLNDQNIGISIGNEGVSTDRQTNRQTNRQTQNPPKTHENPIENAANILDSLDSLKKEIRLKFKRLTERELLVFSTLYQLDEEQGFADYKALSKKLNLTESSIRDYVSRLVSKGIPVEKTKINNKNIQLKVAQNLKKVASLPTILQLIDL